MYQLKQLHFCGNWFLSLRIAGVFLFKVYQHCFCDMYRHFLVSFEILDCNLLKFCNFAIFDIIIYFYYFCLDFSLYRFCFYFCRFG